MKGSWNHLMCEDCWAREHPDRAPVRVRWQEPSPCCFCGTPTASGIYVRRDPDVVHPDGSAP